jgi:rod shape-determining protein MreC
LSSEAAALRDEKNQNQILREQLGLIPKDKFDLEASFVIGQDPERYEGWILIDKGSSSGIKVGMPVIVSNSILIGKISEVYIGTSRVKLLTDSSSVINAIDTETNAKGIIRGEYGLGIILDLVSQNDIINTGDTVVTSGLGGDFPRGLLIGKIQEIKLTQDKLFQQAIIATRARYSKLDVVFVIKNQ